MSNSFKTVLLTGASGFLGKHIKPELENQGFSVLTLGRNNSDISNDLSKEIPELPEKIDYLVHSAGKAHVVPKTKKQAELFYETNYQGTLNLLDGIKQSGSNLKSIIFISSVAVYGLPEGKNIDENAALSASDPYGKSKIMAEKLILDFCLTNNINYCILRLPLIAGKNAPGNLGSMIKAINKGWYLSIGKANAKKSVVMAVDIAELIPSLFTRSGIYNLTDGYHPTFSELERAIARALGKKKPVKKISQRLARLIANTGDLIGKKSPINSAKLKKIQSELTFTDKKAVEELGWKPAKVIDNIDKII